MKLRNCLHAAVFLAASVAAGSSWTADNESPAPAAPPPRLARIASPQESGSHLLALLVSTAGDNRIDLPGVTTRDRCAGLGASCTTDSDCCSDNCQYDYGGRHCARNPFKR
jgi:hypothetical protein